jgi:hypothetical protein
VVNATTTEPPPFLVRARNHTGNKWSGPDPHRSHLALTPTSAGHTCKPGGPFSSSLPLLIPNSSVNCARANEVNSGVQPPKDDDLTATPGCWRCIPKASAALPDQKSPGRSETPQPSSGQTPHAHLSQKRQCTAEPGQYNVGQPAAQQATSSAASPPSNLIRSAARYVLHAPMCPWFSCGAGTSAEPKH